MPMPASCGDAIVAAIVDMSAVPCQFGGASGTGGMESFCAGAAGGFFLFFFFVEGFCFKINRVPETKLLMLRTLF